MRRLAFGCAWGVALAVAGCPGTQRDLDNPPPADADTNPPDATLDVVEPPVIVRVLTWNVRNLFNDVRDSPEIDVADELILSAAEYQTKLDAITTVLKMYSPDIAVLQEVENQPVIADLADRAGYPHRYVTLGNDPRGIDIALLSRFPFPTPISHAEESFSSSATGDTYSFARDLLEVHFALKNKTLVLIGVHFKSGVEAYDQDKRLAEAERTRQLVTALDAQDPSRMIIVLGDFNTVPSAPPMAALAGAAPTPLASVTAGLLADDRFSVTFGGTPQLFDDQYADPDAAAALDAASVKIDHGSDVNAAADHDPVIATYVLQ